MRERESDRSFKTNKSEFSNYDEFNCNPRFFVCKKTSILKRILNCCGNSFFFHDYGNMYWRWIK